MFLDYFRPQMEGRYNPRQIMISPVCGMGKVLSAAQDNWAVMQQEGPIYHSNSN